MRHQGQSQPEKNSRRTALRKLATIGLMGLMLASNTGCRSGGGGGLSSRIRDCRLFNVFRRNQHPQTIVAGDPCCNGVVSGPVIATGDPCGMPVVATADPCATTGATVIQQQGAIITSPSSVNVPSGASTSVPDLAPLDNKPTSNLDAKGANLNRSITSSPSTLQAKTGTSANYR